MERMENQQVELNDFVPDFTSSVIQANKPIQKVKFFKGADIEYIQEEINTFLKDKSLVNIQYQVATNLNTVMHHVMIHYLKED